MLTIPDIEEILWNVKLTFHPEMVFRVAEDSADGCGLGTFWLQLTDPEIGNGRKWKVSPYMTKSEIVQTALGAYLAWVEHEARESFTFRGEAIFSPHFDVDALVELSEAGKFDVRKTIPLTESQYDFDQEYGVK